MAKVKPITAGWILAAVYIAGIIGLLVPQTSKFMRQLIWPTILFTNILLLCYHKKWSKEFVFSILLVALTGFLVDVLAVKTGYVFGYFQYGYTLGYKFWDTPLVMMSYWMVIVYCSRQVAEMIAKDTFLVSLLAAGCMVLMDYFLEPFAVNHGLWHWNEGKVPRHNYVGWFVSGLLIQYVYCKSIKNPPNKLSLVTYLVQLGFFIAMFLLGK
jgi:uncharacterized membrane protein